MIYIYEKNMKFPLLLDTYGVLLTERKREILDYYYNDDYSLSEISELTGISRQGVRDSIKRAEFQLTEFEEQLGLAQRFYEIKSKLEEIKKNAFEIEQINSRLYGSKEIDMRVSEIKSLAQKVADL